MTDEKKESIAEKTESRIKVENLPVEERELTTEDAEALKGGTGEAGTLKGGMVKGDPVARYHLTDAWPSK